VFEFLTYIYR